MLLAHRDLDAARALHEISRGGPEIVGFHCQQAIEKALKAFLVSRGVAAARVHDLGI